MLLMHVDSINREARFSVPFDSIHKVKLSIIFRYVPVPSLRGFMPSEGPKRRQIWLSKHILVILNYLLGCPRHEKVNFKLTSEGNVAKSCLEAAIFSKSDDWQLSVGITEIYTEIFMLFPGFGKDKRMYTI
jgi:hypothetical protein